MREQMDWAEKATTGRGDTAPEGTKTTSEVLKAAKVAQAILITYVKGLELYRLGGKFNTRTGRMFDLIRTAGDISARYAPAGYAPYDYLIMDDNTPRINDHDGIATGISALVAANLIHEILKRYLAKEKGMVPNVADMDRLLDILDSFSESFEDEVPVRIFFQVRGMGPSDRCGSVIAEDLHETYDTHRRSALSQLRSIAGGWGVDYMVPSE